jgi:hypothetical protein
VVAAFDGAVAVGAPTDLVRWSPGGPVAGREWNSPRAYWRDVGATLRERRAASPLRLGGHGSAPLLLFHSRVDEVVPVAQAHARQGPFAAGRITDYNYTSLLHGPQCRPHHRGSVADASWARPRRMTVLTDSVLLGGAPALRAARPCWRVGTFGRPFLSIRDAVRELHGKRVSPVVVLGLGYNSSWERGRKHYAFWAHHFDGDARRLLRTLRRRGARQFVWVTARQPTKRVTPRKAWGELGLAWYLRYVNERLRRLDRDRNDLVLADWNAASRRPGLTYDAIHLNPRGARLMAHTIRTTILAETRRQAARSTSATSTRVRFRAR